MSHTKTGAPCTYSHNGRMYPARFTGNAMLRDSFFEVEIVITDSRKTDCDVLRHVGARLWVMPSEVDHPQFWKRAIGGLVSSGKVSQLENAIWKGEHMKGPEA